VRKVCPDAKFARKIDIDLDEVLSAAVSAVNFDTKDN
jgi:hypothetical protein